ncbi:MAG: hypothetical protein HOE92_08155 [Euryarchaeota archaeon]|jgi:hypothetical protein|nr:hypothetical protein [Euryarchaeota archaeon]MBT3972174.1 hypothetical protein [Euryarchaeota archaeon]MBT4406970.1 hypothetical protein [Euryarchaeota archaeon]MBT6644941.1 hypothetical protein [Euryarchaeota archaeon]
MQPPASPPAEEELSHPADSLDEPHPADSIGPTAGPTTGPPESAPGPTAGPTGTFSASAGLDDAKAVKKTRRQEVEELRETVKKARWNVYLFLGVGAILFGFSLFPLSTPGIWDDGNLQSDSFSSLGTIEAPQSIYGVPGMTIDVDVDIWVMDEHGGDIELFLVPNSCEDSNVVYTQSTMRDEGSMGYFLLENAAPGSKHTIELESNPTGPHCLIVEYLEGNDERQESLEVAIHVYMLRIPLGIFAVLSLGWSLFGFFGAQKRGKKLKVLSSPKKAPSTEKQVMDAARKQKLATGPSAPPSPADSGPDGPPATAQETPPVEAAAPTPTLTPTAPQVNYVTSGDGYYFIQNEDETFQPQAYYLGADGQYILYQG